MSPRGLCDSPHVDVERLELVDLEASGPGAVGRVQESNTQQLVVVVSGPVEDDAGAGQGGDVTLWVGGPLTQINPPTECCCYRVCVCVCVCLTFPLANSL